MSCEIVGTFSMDKLPTSLLIEGIHIGDISKLGWLVGFFKTHHMNRSLVFPVPGCEFQSAKSWIHFNISS
jgi:hypothetical protein